MGWVAVIQSHQLMSCGGETSTQAQAVCLHKQCILFSDSSLFPLCPGVVCVVELCVAQRPTPVILLPPMREAAHTLHALHFLLTPWGMGLMGRDETTRSLAESELRVKPWVLSLDPNMVQCLGNPVARTDLLSQPYRGTPKAPLWTISSHAHHPGKGCP